MALSVPPLRKPPALTSVVIAGGGLAGASAACRLAQAGCKVTLLERETGPSHKVCGEFLSADALHDLASLGIDVEGLGASTISAMRLVHRGRVIESRLPFKSCGLSRMVLDEALLRRAARSGAEIHRGVRVRSAASGIVHTDAGALAAPTLLLATGKHDLRGLPRSLASQPEALIGFKSHLRLRPGQQDALAGHIEVVVFDGGYAGLQLVEHGIANLCLLVNRARYESLGQSWPSLLAGLQREDAHLATRLTGAVECWPRPLSIFRVPFGFVYQEQDQAGVYRLGDQAAVIPSFCGDGMAIALHSSRLAASSILAGRGSAAYHATLREHAGPPIRLAGALYRTMARPVSRSAVLAALRIWPGLLGALARRTRVVTP